MLQAPAVQAQALNSSAALKVAEQYTWRCYIQLVLPRWNFPGIHQTGRCAHNAKAAAKPSWC